MDGILEAYCDGGCSPNPGESSLAWVILHKNKPYRGSKYLGMGTNNTAELNAAVDVLRFIKTHFLYEGYASMIVYSDSSYTVKGITTWIIKWVKNNWKDSKKAPVKNSEIWSELHKLVTEFPIPVQFEWVKGHSGNKYNEECDIMATRALTRREGHHGN